MQANYFHVKKLINLQMYYLAEANVLQLIMNYRRELLKTVISLCRNKWGARLYINVYVYWIPTLA